MKKIPIALIYLFAVSALAVTILWYSQAPHAGTGSHGPLATNDIILIERPSPHTNLYANLGELKALVGGSGPGGSQVWTNDGTFMWPSGQPAPDVGGTNAGPAFFIRKDGSYFAGTNVTADTSVENLSVFKDYQVSMTESNESAEGSYQRGAIDSENYGKEGVVFGNWKAGDNDSNVSWVWAAQNTNGNNDSFKITVAPDNGQGTPADSSVELKVNSVSVFKADKDGTVTANRYKAAGTTNAFILPCPDGGSFILTVGNNGILNVVTNSGGL